MPWNAASRWRTSGGRRTTSASIRVSGFDSSEIGPALAVERGPGDPAAAAEQVGDDVAGPVCASIRAATSAGGGAGASRSKIGSAGAGSGFGYDDRPVIR